jgi:hypothetical protein
MSVERFEVGIVSGDRALVDFLAETFQLEERPGARRRHLAPSGRLPER